MAVVSLASTIGIPPRVKFNSVNELRREGFTGLRKIGKLLSNRRDVPTERGVYMVLYLAEGRPVFLVKGPGRHHVKRGKRIDPNVSIEKLKERWVDDTIVLYVGQAGGKKNGVWSSETLSARIDKYMRFGQGKNSGHWGGRLIWQIRDYRDLIMCWNIFLDKRRDPKEAERELLEQFISIYGTKPFANLKRDC